ncbi:imidazole glycerol phosphate synthase subunit HisH [Salinisphaera sp. USBA-960]|uniref:imidazole glycerol phosphate synthase subunit HisH n=1 Tax=Salinisphaera orenii TaxID=856731 RepID=UPI000DBE519C|nr:imidazole glycerol phosphate synthase subunit HisH [Salifodinibacter halophilus]NNC25484.1 imidazole glycerol phosphate synthase subunit HisH [Salifodinibacter halophilus]
MATVGIIDYGMGNLHSIGKALDHVSSGESIEVSSDPKNLATKDRLILPGVGAIGYCMNELARLGLDDMVRRFIETRPLMGICLGIEMLMAHSEESGGVSCLGAFDGDTVAFASPDAQPDGRRRKIPHMGWNQIRQTRDHQLWQNIDAASWFYFVHSYYALPTNANDIAGTTTYGLEFASVLLRPNVFAVQFHPEKSQSPGLQLLANFLAWNGQAG